MSRDDFPLCEFEARRDAVRWHMSDAGLDWIIVTHPASIYWLTGSDAKSFISFQCLLISVAAKELRMIVRISELAELQDDAVVDDVIPWGFHQADDSADVFRGTIRMLGMDRQRVALEESVHYLGARDHVMIVECLGAALVQTSPSIVSHLRLAKSECELAHVRRAAAIADGALLAGLGLISIGRSELEIAAEIYRHMLASGGSQPVTALNLASGPRSSFSHGAPTARKLEFGDTGHIEFGVPFRRYPSTIGRQFVIGTPGTRVAELHRFVRDACAAAISTIRAGVEGFVVHAAANAVLEKAGLEAFAVHTLGYAIGPGFPPGYAEQYRLARNERQPLLPGMVLSICPHVFIPSEKLGVRLVQNVIVRSDGNEVLSTLPDEIICC
ncbi:MAG: aminopeptidase P family protein [Mesorhizobium sp.]|uniref:M24 family metallopeptidase n=1 Tax=Mesorhizobium sp. TaxID=1871066 RepID=UPI000FE488AC|nr:Xaa-Pro peptidase family protein [Mesorhizobium sp.]RWI08682.1 MAG: aminopeptidase P family protein [Mesorhizobium sp.]RWM85687.1 MAG: aminopeptidase P family protein [Mesorhizobium sp.]TIO14279.1 MAG: aminopeptidase P family protein [Mesorhizobium sp.]TIP92842.1 MAG: aminopeptidase P family protein [Mesorhizobium sp.]